MTNDDDDRFACVWCAADGCQSCGWTGFCQASCCDDESDVEAVADHMSNWDICVDYDAMVVAGGLRLAGPTQTVQHGLTEQEAYDLASEMRNTNLTGSGEPLYGPQATRIFITDGTRTTVVWNRYR